MSRAKGSLTLADSATGEPLSTTVAFREADGVTALAAALFAANSGGSATTTHQTDGRGELDRYVDYAQRATVVAAGDTVAQPITFDADPADVAAFASDGATLTRGYRALARMRVAAIEAKVRDIGGVVHNVDAYAAALGLVVNDGVGDPTTALQAIVAALNGAPGVIQYGPGTYLSPSVSFYYPSNTVIRGAGIGVTVLKHRGATARPVISVDSTVSTSNVTVMDLTVDGNLAENLDYNISEISLESAATGTHTSSDHGLIRVEVKNGNKLGVAIGGVRNTMSRCHVHCTPPTGAYADTANPSFATRYGGLVGIITSGGVYCRDILIDDCTVHGFRSAGVEPGGSGFIISQCRLRDNHRWDDPAGTPGSQLAPTITRAADDSGYVFPTDGVIVDTLIEDETFGTWSGGMELNSCTNIQVLNCIIRNSYGWGIHIASSGQACSNITIANTTITDISRHAIAVGLGSSNAIELYGTNPIRGVRMSNVTVANCRNALYTVGDVAGYHLWGWNLNNNTAGWTKGDTASDWTSGAHGYTNTSHAPLPNRTYHNYGSGVSVADETWAQTVVNVHASGHGLRVQGGADGSHYALKVDNVNGNVYAVFGDGQALLKPTSAALSGLRVDITQAAAGLYGHLLLSRNTVNKARLGLDASDFLAVIKADGSAGVFSVDPATGNAVLSGGLTAIGATLPTGNLNVTAGNLNMTAGSVVVNAGLVSTPSLYFSGTTTGLYSSGAGVIDFSSTGTRSLSISAAGLLDFRIAAAAVALGGGAAPTVGTIGGSGPATAAQNSWLKVLIGGIASYIPVWR